MPCQPGKLGLWYPKWIPGTHAPSGPIQDVAGLRLETPDGKPLPWRRDESDVFKVECNVPDGVHEIVARLDVICTGPAVEAAGHLSYGNNSVGMLNWSNCLLYPDGPSCDDTMVQLPASALPRGWRFATALEADQASDARNQPPAADGRARLKPVSLRDLIDNPLIAGEHLPNDPPRSSQEPTPLPGSGLGINIGGMQLGPKVVELYSRMVREAGSLFGPAIIPRFTSL